MKFVLDQLYMVIRRKEFASHNVDGTLDWIAYCGNDIGKEKVGLSTLKVFSCVELIPVVVGYT